MRTLSWDYRNGSDRLVLVDPVADPGIPAASCPSFKCIELFAGEGKAKPAANLDYELKQALMGLALELAAHFGHSLS